MKIGLEWTPSYFIVMETSFSASKYYRNHKLPQWYGAMICDPLKMNIGYKSDLKNCNIGIRIYGSW